MIELKIERNGTTLTSSAEIPKFLASASGPMSIQSALGRTVELLLRDLSRQLSEQDKTGLVKYRNGDVPVGIHVSRPEAIEIS